MVIIMKVAMVTVMMTVIAVVMAMSSTTKRWLEQTGIHIIAAQGLT